jgi:hypothetical protein
VKIVIKQCVHCGCDFEIDESNHHERKREYCSKKCIHKAQYKRKKGAPVLIEKVCEECGKTYIAKRHDSVTCGRDCNYERNRKRVREAGIAYRERMRAERLKLNEELMPKKKYESIEDIQRKARAVGMSYGKYLVYMSMQKGAYK